MRSNYRYSKEIPFECNKIQDLSHIVIKDDLTVWLCLAVDEGKHYLFTAISKSPHPHLMEKPEYFDDYHEALWGFSRRIQLNLS